MPAATRNFRHLNSEGRWPGFAMTGLESDDAGVLRLDSLPVLADSGVDAESLPAPAGVTGVAADSSGAIYAVDRDSGAVVRLDDCVGSGRRETILRSSGDLAGIAIAPLRHALYLAERSAGRVRIVDLDSGQTTDSWAGLDQPTALAFDGTGALYVVESASGHVRKFGVSGLEDAAFAAATAAIAATDVAAVTVNGDTTVYILDAPGRLIHPVAADGSPAGAPFGQADLQQPLGIAADTACVYVGDNGRRRLLAFKRGPEHHFVGEAIHYRGPVAGLAIVPLKGGLLLHSGSNATILRLERNAGRRSQGLLWSTAPIRAGARKRLWSRLKALAQTNGGGLQFFWAFGLNAPPVAPESTDPFPATHWLAGPSSVLDLHLGEVEDERLWLAARFSSDGFGNPTLEQIRVEFDREGYIQNLPAIYREGPGAELLSRFLTLFETFFEEGQAGIRHLPDLFDPYAVPAEALDWLASWLAVEIHEDWSEDMRRETVATAYERYARRGTPQSLREELWRQAGVRVHIAEPLQRAHVWTLPRDPDPCACGGDPNCECGCAAGGSSLGWSTMLAPAEWQGAVAGVSATLDQSHLIFGEEIGSPLWRDFAHRFTVYLYRGASDCPGRAAEIEAVIAREKPAHTLHRVCPIEPRMRVGFQAVVGVDAVVAGQSPTRLESGENEWILGGPPPGRVGASRVGMTTRL